MVVLNDGEKYIEIEDIFSSNKYRDQGIISMDLRHGIIIYNWRLK